MTCSLVVAVPAVYIDGPVWYGECACAHCQAAYFAELRRIVSSVPNGRGIGLYYWEPALISPEALSATKLAINRGADAAGFRNAIQAGLDVLAPLYAAGTEVGRTFDEIREKEGLGAALRWRAAQLAE